MKPRLRATPEQYSALIQFMERHGDLSRPGSADGRLKGARLWRELTNLLNSIDGGVKKTEVKWKKAWVDWKVKKKKQDRILKYHAPFAKHTLTAFDKRVLAIVAAGQASIQGQDISAPSQSSDESIVQNEKNEESIIQDDKSEEPIVQDIKIEESIELNENSEEPIDQGEEREEPIDQGEEREGPIDRGEEREEPIDQGEEREEPIDRGEEREEPIVQDIKSEDIVLKVTHTNSSIPTPPLASSLPRLATRFSEAPRPLKRGMDGEAASPAATAPRRIRLLTSGNLGKTHFYRAASGFDTMEHQQLQLEHQRLQLEETREKSLREREMFLHEREVHLHEREMERLRLEAQRIEATREQNQLLRHLSIIAERLLDKLQPG